MIVFQLQKPCMRAPPLTKLYSVSSCFQHPKEHPAHSRCSINPEWLINIQFTSKSCCCYLLNILWIRLLLSITTLPTSVQSPSSCTWILLPPPRWLPSMHLGYCEAKAQIWSGHPWKRVTVFCGFSWLLGRVPSTSPWPAINLASLGSLLRPSSWVT